MATQMNMKLMIHKPTNKVLFAKAGRCVVDFLFSLLLMPMASIIKLLTQEQNSQTFSSIGSLYKSADALDKSCFVSDRNKTSLLNPASNAALFLTGYSTTFMQMTKELRYFDPTTGTVVATGDWIVKGAVTYTVMDDLTIMSSTSSIALLTKLNVKDVSSLEERIVTLGMKEGLELLKASLQSKTVLNDVFIAQKAERVTKYKRDSQYRFLHDRVSDLFAGMLASDVEQLKLGKLNKIGLAAKWCPSLDSSFDKSTLVCESIARKIWPRDSVEEYKDIEEEHYAYRVRDRLRKEVLVPLREVLQLPEVYMTAKKWDQLPYNRVASVAMKNYVEIFKKRDLTRFSDYLSRVKEGKAKIAAGALLPHEILDSAFDEEAGDVAELQWNRMVQDLLEMGKLKNCIAVCDVSGSMCGTPLDVCVAMGLLVSELSEEPWKGRVITFSKNPQLHLIKGEKLVDKYKFVAEMDWNMNTDFQKVFDRILDVAKEGKLKEDEMIKRVFVFTDMEFDEASANNWETDYEVICRKFRENGYGSCIPEIVFWNLRDSKSTPVSSNQKGVALVSGFSKNLMKIFLEGDGEIDPMIIMERAISGKKYQQLVVFD